MGTHLGGVVSDLVLAATGVGAAKLFKTLSKTKYGKKLVQALDNFKKITKLGKSKGVSNNLNDVASKIDNVLDAPVARDNILMMYGICL